MFYISCVLSLDLTGFDSVPLSKKQGGIEGVVFLKVRHEKIQGICLFKLYYALEYVTINTFTFVGFPTIPVQTSDPQTSDQYKTSDFH